MIWLRSALLLAGALVLGGCSDDATRPPEDVPLRITGAEADAQGRYLVDFGTVASKAAPRTRTVGLANPRRSSVRVGAIPAAPPFAVEPADGLALDAGAGAALTISYDPEIDGRHEQIVDLTYDGGRITLRLVGVAGAAIDCAPDRIDFGNVPLNESQHGSLACSNSSSQPVQVATGQLSGDDAAYFTATLPAGFQVAPGTEFTIEATFQNGPDAGTRTATLPLVVDGLAAGQIELRAESVASTLAVEPACADGGVDFGFVAVGGTVERTLVLRHTGSGPLLIDDLQPDGAGDFQVLTQAPLQLRPDDPATPEREDEAGVRIAFAPTTTGQQTSRITMATTPGAPVEACVRGHGGGPLLACTPGSIDFGPVGVGMPLTRTFACTNAGADVPGTILDNLHVEEVRTGSDVFDAVVVNPDGSTGPKTQGYASGERFDVLVTFDPAAAGPAAADVVLLTNDAIAPVATFRVTAEGRALQPCNFAIAPQALDFGLVPAGGSALLEFAVRNLSGEACLINDLRLAGQASPFSLADAATDHVLAGNEELRIGVRFDAPASGDGSTLADQVRFEISAANGRSQAIPVRGASGTSCLVAAPDPIDLGTAALSCSTEPKELLLYNTCASPIGISSIGLAPSAACPDSAAPGCPFVVAEAPALPASIAPGGWVAVEVAYAAGGEADHRGGLHVAFDGGADPLLVQLRGGANADAIRIDSFAAPARPKVDILWVIDDSGHAMVQQALGNAFPHFLGAAQTARADFHLGVTTTDTNSLRGPKGRLVPLDGSRPRILHENTPDLEAAWAANVNVGTRGSADEKGLLAAMLALSPGLIDVADDPDTPEPNDGNLGFLRSDAALAIVFVAGAADADSTPTSDYLDFFRQVKGAHRPELLKVHAIAPDLPTPGGPPGGGCPTDGADGNGERYNDLVEATGGIFRSFCSPDWGQVMADIGNATFDSTSRYALTNRARCSSCDDEIVVRLAGTPAPAVVDGVRRWRYDAAQNAVVFVPAFRPTPGTDVTVEYTVVCH